MISKAHFDKEIELIISNAIREDVGDGDHSSLACIPASALGKAKLLVKDEGIIAGVEVFAYVDANMQVETLIEDGSKVKHGDIVFYVEGASQSILKAERLVLNAMQRMSAIATKTRQFVDLLEGTGTKILDTRIDFAGGVAKAINLTKQYLKDTNRDLKIIVEARNLEEIKKILDCGGVYRILIDNFNYEDTRKAVKLIGDQCLTESSGGINENTLRKYAECGVDYISSGALTHSVYNMDLSLKAV